MSEPYVTLKQSLLSLFRSPPPTHHPPEGILESRVLGMEFPPISLITFQPFPLHGVLSWATTTPQEKWEERREGGERRGRGGDYWC